MRPALLASAVVLTAVVVRLVHIESFDPRFVNVDQYGDIAESLVRGHGFSILSSADIAAEDVDPPVRYPTAKRTPGMPLFVAGIYAVFGERPSVALAFQALLDGVVVLLAFLLARRLLGSAGLAALVALGYALYPPELHMVVRLWTEPLFAALLLGGTLVALDARRTGRTGLAAAVGLLRGLGVLVRPGLLPFLLLEALFVAGGDRAARGRRAAAYLLGAALALAPWIVRNALVFDGWIGVTTFTGYNLYVGHDPSHDGRYHPYDRLPDELRAALRGRSEPEQDRILRRAAVERFLGNGLVVNLRHAGLKALRFFFHVDRRTERPTGKSVAVNGPLLLLAALGALALVRRRERVALFVLTAPLLYFLALHVATVSRMRFLFPVLPLVLILAVVGIRAWWPRGRPALYDPPS